MCQRVPIHGSYVLRPQILRTLRYGDYGQRTTAGSHFQDWDETCVFSHPNRRKLATVRSRRVLRSAESWTTDPSKRYEKAV